MYTIATTCGMLGDTDATFNEWDHTADGYTAYN